MSRVGVGIINPIVFSVLSTLLLCAGRKSEDDLAVGKSSNKP